MRFVLFFVSSPSSFTLLSRRPVFRDPRTLHPPPLSVSTQLLFQPWPLPLPPRRPSARPPPAAPSRPARPTARCGSLVRAWGGADERSVWGGRRAGRRSGRGRETRNWGGYLCLFSDSPRTGRLAGSPPPSTAPTEAGGSGQRVWRRGPAATGLATRRAGASPLFFFFFRLCSAHPPPPPTRQAPPRRPGSRATCPATAASTPWAWAPTPRRWRGE